MADDTADDAYNTCGYTVSFQNMSGAEWYKVPNSGSRDHIATRTDGRFAVEIEDGEVSEGLHSYTLTSKVVIAIYNHLSYQYSTKRLQQLQN